MTAPNEALEIPDLRSDFFEGAEWYDRLEQPAAGQESAWYLAKSHEPAWFIVALNAGLYFAEEHGLRDHYRARLGGIRPPELLPARARAEGRTCNAPIWEISNELIVARLLERAAGWQFVQHEPPGRATHRGEWLLRAPTTGNVFVEVKTIAEPEIRGGPVFLRPDYTHRVRKVLARAYGQLPDVLPTLVVLVGNDITRIPFGIMYGDVFQALFGRMHVTFNVLPFDPESVRSGPSFRDMFVHGTKHRQLGCAAGLVIGGLNVPYFNLYAVHNPFAYEASRLEADDLSPFDQFVVDRAGLGNLRTGLPTDDVWRRLL